VLRWARVPSVDPTAFFQDAHPAPLARAREPCPARTRAQRWRGGPPPRLGGRLPRARAPLPRPRGAL